MVIIKAIGSDRSALLPASLRWSRNNKMTSNTSCDPRGTNTQSSRPRRRPRPRPYPHMWPVPLATPSHPHQPPAMPAAVRSKYFSYKKSHFFALSRIIKLFLHAFHFISFEMPGVAEGRAAFGGRAADSSALGRRTKEDHDARTCLHSNRCR